MIDFRPDRQNERQTSTPLLLEATQDRLAKRAGGSYAQSPVILALSCKSGMGTVDTSPNP